MSYCTLFFLLLAFACFSILTFTFHRCNLLVRIWFNQMFLNNKDALPINLPGLAYFDIGLCFLFLYFLPLSYFKAKTKLQHWRQKREICLGKTFPTKDFIHMKKPPNMHTQGLCNQGELDRHTWRQNKSSSIYLPNVAKKRCRAENCDQLVS